MGETMDGWMLSLVLKIELHLGLATMISTIDRKHLLLELLWKMIATSIVLFGVVSSHRAFMCLSPFVCLFCLYSMAGSNIA